MNTIDMFKGFSEKPSDFPMLCSAVSTISIGMKSLEAFLKDTTGISDKVLVSVKSVVTAFDTLKKECTPEGCYI